MFNANLARNTIFYLKKIPDAIYEKLMVILSALSALWTIYNGFCVAKGYAHRLKLLIYPLSVHVSIEVKVHKYANVFGHYDCLCCFSIGFFEDDVVSRLVFVVVF